MKFHNINCLLKIDTERLQPVSAIKKTDLLNRKET